MHSKRNRMVCKRAHVEDHCCATRNTCGLEGDIPAGMITEYLFNRNANVRVGMKLGHHLFRVRVKLVRRTWSTWNSPTNARTSSSVTAPPKCPPFPSIFT